MFRWNALENDNNYPPEFTAVLVYVNYGQHFNIFTAHHEEKIWFTFDSFAKTKQDKISKIFREQGLITHWCFPVTPKTNLIQLLS